MFDKLPKHHIGFIVPVSQRPLVEQRLGKGFHFDAIQGTHVVFSYDEALGLYIEYICQEGRVAKQPAGFAHICYDLQGRERLQQVEDWIAAQKLGYALTELEKSGSAECGWIKFYYLKNFGVIELNVHDH